jgi:hypothetical protein
LDDVKRLVASGAAAIAALTMSACAAAAGSTVAAPSAPSKLNGLYKTRITNSPHYGALNGVWRLRFRSDGTYTFNYTGQRSKNVIISGPYVIVGHAITLRDRSMACSAKPGSGGCRYLGCPKPVRYAYKLRGQALTFAKVQDRNTNCELPAVLAGKFRRV